MTFVLMFLIFSSQNNSDGTEMVPMGQEEQPNVTPDSSTTVNSKSDLDNTLMMYQVMLIVFYIIPILFLTHCIHYLFFCTGNVHGFIQMERKNGAAAAGCIEHCIWNADNEVVITWNVTSNYQVGRIINTFRSFYLLLLK